MKEKRHPKSKKTFWYITGLLSLLTVFSCVYFGTYISQLLRNDNESAEINRSLQLLERAAYQSDDLFRSLSYQMESLLWNESGIALLVNPFAADESALQNCLLNLQQNAASNQFVNEILLYSPISNKVYSSRKTHVPLNYSARSDLVTRFYYDSAADTTRRNAIDVKFVTTESDYFLVFEIRMPRLIGVMICQLNHRALQSMLSADNINNEIQAYSAEGIALLKTNKDHLSPAQLTDDTLFITNSAQQKRDAAWYRVTSELTGWTYIMPVSDGARNSAWYHYVPVLLPVLIAFMLIGFMTAYFSARRIYSPIQKMMDISMESPQLLPRETSAYRSEIGYLTSVFNNAVSSNKKYRAYAETMSEEVLEHLLAKVLLGRGISKEYAEGLLTSIERAGMMHDVFYLLLIRISSGREAGDFELHMTNRAIMNAANSAVLSEGEKFVITPVREEIAIVFAFRDGTEEERIERVLSQYEKALMKQVDALETEIAYCMSDEYIGLYNLRYCYRDTLERLNYLEYRDASESETMEDAELLPEQVHIAKQRREHKQEQLMKLINYAQRGEVEKAEFGFTELVGYELAQAKTIEDAIAEITPLILSLREHVLSYSLDDADLMKLNEQKAEIEQLHECSTIAVLGRKAKELGRLPMQVLMRQGRKKTTKYVESAKAYIDTHYMENMLSLNDVADSIGISAHYLSRLFTEIEGMTFISYVNKRRIQQSKQLLEQTQLSVSEIGFRCGFASVQSFCRTFKKYTEATPSQFRNEEVEA